MRTIRIGFGLGNQSTRSPLEPVLIAYNWPKNTDRYRRAQGFVEAFSLGPPPFASCRATQNAARSLSLRIGRLGSFRAGPGCEANKTQQACWLSVSPDDQRSRGPTKCRPIAISAVFGMATIYGRQAAGRGFADAPPVDVSSTLLRYMTSFRSSFRTHCIGRLPRPAAS
jgi:hypothetical protein